MAILLGRCKLEQNDPFTARCAGGPLLRTFRAVEPCGHDALVPMALALQSAGKSDSP